MFHYALFAAFAAVVPLSCASTVSADFVLAQRSEEIEAVANSDSILEAFIEANHPAASPNRTMSEYGDFDMYMFDVRMSADGNRTRRSAHELCGRLQAVMVSLEFLG